MSEKKLVGMHLPMSLSNDRTPELFKRFMPNKKSIENCVGMDIFEVVEYDPILEINSFTSATPFEKWAAVEVLNFSKLPSGMDTFVLPAGLYAVFIHKGPAHTFRTTFEFIFSTWLPQSAFHLDKRPQFQILGPKYKNNDPESEEEVWIPILPKP
jgi:AraC family transcriptional regulator